MRMETRITCETCPWGTEVENKPGAVWCRNAKVNTGGANFGGNTLGCPEHPDMKTPDITDERTNLNHIKPEDRQ